jgi:hypothetical protein
MKYGHVYRLMQRLRGGPRKKEVEVQSVHRQITY